jgi:hypothetical protein
MTGSHYEYKQYCKKRNEAQATSDKLRRNFENIIAKEVMMMIMIDVQR